MHRACFVGVGFSAYIFFVLPNFVVDNKKLGSHSVRVQ